MANKVKHKVLLHQAVCAGTLMTGSTEVQSFSCVIMYYIDEVLYRGYGYDVKSCQLA